MGFKELTQNELKRRLRYDLNTGIFTWKECGRKDLIGKAAGSINGDGYTSIKFTKGVLKNHRLAFLYVLGWMPEMVDHINMDRSDNRWINLRPATRSQNNHNTPARKGSKYKKGVSIKYGKFLAQIQVDKKKIHLGYFDTEDEAHEEYRKASERHVGQFSRV